MTTPFQATTKMPQVGEAAPKFTLPSYPAGPISLIDYAGKKNVILAFYPKDNTPGCTKELCSFSDMLSELQDLSTEVLSVSCDSLESHKAFASKFNFLHPLLSDTEAVVGKLYGVLSEGRSMPNRVLFVIDKQGIVQQVVEGMPDNNKLLDLIKQLK